MKPHWQGVFPAITTQMHPDGSLNMEATAAHAEILIASGVSGMIFLGSLGEIQPMEAAERRLLMKEMIGVVKGRVPVLSGVAETSTAAAMAYLKDLEGLGASGLDPLAPDEELVVRKHGSPCVLGVSRCSDS